MNRVSFVLIALLLLAFSQNSYSQTYKDLLGQDQINTITTAVPFLLIAPDSRGGAMGDIGVSTTPDVNSQFWNPAKYPFIETDLGFAVNYSPWLSKLVDDINLAYLSGYYRINNISAVSASLRYFSLGSIQFTDRVGGDLGTYKPNEFSIDATYSRKLTENFSGAVGIRYIRSDLTQGQTANGVLTEPGQTVAADVAVYYQKSVKWFKTKGLFAFGANVSNLGGKISYSETLERDFIPMNLRIGPSLTLELDKYNKLMIAVDINKLLVPTPPVYAKDTAGNNIPLGNGRFEIESGMDPDRGIVNALFTSFYDAPSGFAEEMREFNVGAGAEYIYDEKFFIRGGYFYEHATKGNRKFFTLGLGFKYNVFAIDISYLIPTTQANPLENTLRFSLLFNFLNAENQ
ncbi:MAG: type IX secretion system outer membrane channel protein PorV [Bacteroidales bacterium]|nr:type IX secretion system outer membrane channel protein PorV [Bacteroidales bacterium]